MTYNTADEQRLSMNFLQPKTKKDRMLNLNLDSKTEIIVIDSQRITARYIEPREPVSGDPDYYVQQGDSKTNSILVPETPNEKMLNMAKPLEGSQGCWYRRDLLIDILSNMSADCVKLSVKEDAPINIAEPRRGDYRRIAVIAPSMIENTGDDWED